MGKKQNNIYGITFPVNIFPDELQKILEHYFDVMQIQKSYLGASALFTLSVACGNRYSLNFSGYDIIPSLWVALVGDVSMKKTPAINIMTKPLQQLDKVKYNEYIEKISELKKSKDEDKDLQTAPVYQRNLVNDFTTESLVDILYNNPNGIGVYSDELKQWVNNFDRYSKGSDKQFWLSIFSNTAITNDRKGKTTIRIEKPFTSVIGGIQTNILSSLKDKNYSDDGFIERILFVLNETDERGLWTKKQIDEEIESKYFELVEYISNNNKSYNYGEKEIDYILKWQKNLVAVYPDVDYKILGKMEIYLHRFAIILQVLNDYFNNYDNTTIEDKQVSNAINLVEYFINCAYWCNKMIDEGNGSDENDEDVKQWIRSLPNNFKTKEAVKLGITFKISESKVKRLLKDNKLFKKLAHGEYYKIKNNPLILTDEDLLQRLWDYNNSDEYEHEIPTIQSKLKDYFEDRKQRNKGLSQIAKKDLIERVFKVYKENSLDFVIEKIENSIIGGYNSIYFEDNY